MVFEKDNSGVDILSRILFAIYIYSCFEVDSKRWLNDDLARMYAEMLRDHVSGVDTKRWGWLAGLKMEGVADKKHRYMFVARIKERNWLLKKGGQFIFPERLVKIVENIVSGREDVTYFVKL